MRTYAVLLVLLVAGPALAQEGRYAMRDVSDISIAFDLHPGVTIRTVRGIHTCSASGGERIMGGADNRFEFGSSSTLAIASASGADAGNDVSILCLDDDGALLPTITETLAGDPATATTSTACRTFLRAWVSAPRDPTRTARITVTRVSAPTTTVGVIEAQANHTRSSYRRIPAGVHGAAVWMSARWISGTGNVTVRLRARSATGTFERSQPLAVGATNRRDQERVRLRVEPGSDVLARAQCEGAGQAVAFAYDLLLRCDGTCPQM